MVTFFLILFPPPEVCQSLPDSSHAIAVLIHLTGPGGQRPRVCHFVEKKKTWGLQKTPTLGTDDKLMCFMVFVIFLHVPNKNFKLKLIYGWFKVKISRHRGETGVKGPEVRVDVDFSWESSSGLSTETTYHCSVFTSCMLLHGFFKSTETVNTYNVKTYFCVLYINHTVYSGKQTTWKKYTKYGR